MHLAETHHSINAVTCGGINDGFFLAGVPDRKSQRLHRSIETGNHFQERIGDKDSQRSALRWLRDGRSLPSRMLQSADSGNQPRFSTSSSSQEARTV